MQAPLYRRGTGPGGQHKQQSSQMGSLRPNTIGALAAVNRPAPRPFQRMIPEQISNVVTGLGDIITVLRDAEPADRAEIRQQL